jgi:hypothetical protein
MLRSLDHKGLLLDCGLVTVWRVLRQLTPPFICAVLRFIPLLTEGLCILLHLCLLNKQTRRVVILAGNHEVVLFLRTVVLCFEGRYRLSLFCPEVC